MFTVIHLQEEPEGRELEFGSLLIIKEKWLTDVRGHGPGSGGARGRGRGAESPGVGCPGAAPASAPGARVVAVLTRQLLKSHVISWWVFQMGPVEVHAAKITVF